MKKIQLIVGLILFSVSLFAQNLPTGAVWGNTKVEARTNNNDTSGTITLDQIKSYTTTGLAGGTVTTASVVTANGFAGTVANATTTPAITLTTTLSNNVIPKSNGTGLVAAVAGTDYVIPSGSITGNAATVTTNANMTGDVTSVGNATTIATGAVTSAKLATGAVDLASNKVTGLLPNANLANSAITINGTSTSLGGTRSIDLASVTGVGATTATASTFSGGLTASGGLVQGQNFVNSLSAITTSTSLTTSSNSHQVADATSAAITVTLPSAPANGTTFVITKKNTTTNYVTVTRGGTDTIMGNTSHVIVTGKSPIKFIYNGGEWYVEN